MGASPHRRTHAASSRTRFTASQEDPMKRLSHMTDARHAGNGVPGTRLARIGWLTVLMLLLALAPSPGLAADSNGDSVWTRTAREHHPERKAGPRDYTAYRVEERSLREQMQKATPESSER